ncbi:AI-2E family transporter [Martelella mediterranea]|uniref:Putative PurR-regulated permease PerM n=1 Tax=Martelella mediterranea TaxID=293089 RepID=A0A4R3NSN6_9HYPH|nr:AI-2E family transporter [Martelella mediterranea]TCT35286.1 putative PurR-regulated permease PerM [Martelella mediterranea]
MAQSQEPHNSVRKQRWIGSSSASARVPLIPSVSAARWLLLGVAAAAIYFFHGFIVPVLAALIIAFASQPIFNDLNRRLGNRRALTSAIAIFLILLFLILPIVFAVIYMSRELEAWIIWATEANRIGAPAPDWIFNLPVVGQWIAEKWETYLGQPGDIGQLIQAVSGENIGGIYRTALFVGGRAFGLILAALFMLIALFFIYKDGPKFVGQLDIIGERLFPNRWQRISRVVPATISSTVTGMTLIAMGEGVVLGTAYYLAGVPNYVSFGLITAVMAMVPGGAPLTFTLISGYLIARGTPVHGLALLAWGTIELFIVDKTLRPRLVGGPIKLPFLPTFFGLVGGVKTMGLIGLFLGPVLMALMVAIWREWVLEAADGEKTPEQEAYYEATEHHEASRLPDETAAPPSGQS